MYIQHWSRHESSGGHLSRVHIESYIAAWARAKARERQQAKAAMDAETSTHSCCRSRCNCCASVGLSCGRWWYKHVLEEKRGEGGVDDEGKEGEDEDQVHDEEERIVVAADRADVNDFHLRRDLLAQVLKETGFPLGLAPRDGNEGEGARADDGAAEVAAAAAADEASATIPHTTVHFTDDKGVGEWDAVNFYDLLSYLIDRSTSAGSQSSSPPPLSGGSQEAARVPPLPPVALRRVDSMRRSQKKKGSRHRTATRRRRASLKRGSSDDEVMR